MTRTHHPRHGLPCPHCRGTATECRAIAIAFPSLASPHVAPSDAPAIVVDWACLSCGCQWQHNLGYGWITMEPGTGPGGIDFVREERSPESLYGPKPAACPEIHETCGQCRTYPCRMGYPTPA